LPRLVSRPLRPATPPPPALQHRAAALPHPSPQKHQEQFDWVKWLELRQCAPPLPPPSPRPEQECNRVVSLNEIWCFQLGSGRRWTARGKEQTCKGRGSFVGGCLGNFGVEVHLDTAMRCSTCTIRVCADIMGTTSVMPRILIHAWVKVCRYDVFCRTSK